MLSVQTLRLLQTVPRLARLWPLCQRALAGDRAAQQELARDGLADVLDALDVVQPGIGTALRQTIQAWQHALQPAIDAEYHVIEHPWDGFVRRLLKSPSGGHVILGPVGSGKTSLAIKLARRLGLQHGYLTEVCNLYAEDRPKFSVTIGMNTLVRRMAQLRRYLQAQEVEDLDDPDEAIAPFDVDDEASDEPPTLPPQRRVIIIDEALLAMTSDAHDPQRRAALAALAQCRHLQWHVIYIGQWAGQIPLPLLGQCIVWIKQPSGREATTDRNHPVVRDLWERAMAAFERLPQSRWYRPPFDDRRAWAYVDCQSLNRGPGWHGMVPFTPYRGEDDDGETVPAD